MKTKKSHLKPSVQLNGTTNVSKDSVQVDTAFDIYDFQQKVKLAAKMKDKLKLRRRQALVFSEWEVLLF